MKLKILLITLLLISFISSCRTDRKKELQPNNETNVSIQKNQKLCFLYEMDNSYEKEGKTIIEKDFIEVDLTINNDKVEGEYKITSNKKIENLGHFIGTIENDIITSIHTYKRNGKLLKDELIFKLEDHQISILGGEKKEINGVNMFVDKSKGEYMLQLPKVNCN